MYVIYIPSPFNKLRRGVYFEIRFYSDGVMGDDDGWDWIPV